MAVTTKETIALLLESYCMELETVMNYLANSVNLDGVRAEEIKKSLGADVPGEIAHAQQLANRLLVSSGSGLPIRRRRTFAASACAGSGLPRTASPDVHCAPPGLRSLGATGAAPSWLRWSQTPSQKGGVTPRLPYS